MSKRSESAQTIGSPSDSLGTVGRVTAVLDYVAEARRDVSITELSRNLALSPGTVHRLLGLLVEQGWIERDTESKKYRVGMRFFRTASVVVDAMDLPRLARPFMEKIVEDCRESCMFNLYMPADGKLMLAEVVYADNPLTYRVGKFSVGTLFWGATGLSILAFLPTESIELLYQRAEPSPVTGKPLPPLKQFMERIEKIRAQGYVHTSNEKMAGAVGIGAPIFNANGSVVGSFSATIPDFRFQTYREREIASAVIEHANAFSALLGHRRKTS